MTRKVVYCVLLILSIALTTGCQRIQRGRQIRAQGELQYLTAMIESRRKDGGSLMSADEFRTAFDSRRREDPWGREYLYERFVSSAGERYVLASRGADGVLDVAELSGYLSAIREDVAYMPERDIVVVDGEFVRNAGK